MWLYHEKKEYHLGMAKSSLKPPVLKLLPISSYPSFSNRISANQLIERCHHSDRARGEKVNSTRVLQKASGANKCDPWA